MLFNAETWQGLDPLLIQNAQNYSYSCQECEGD